MRAFFELRAREPHDWNRLFKKVSRDRRAVLLHWHLEGLGILSRLRAQEATGPEVRLPSSLADEFRMRGRGRGMRSLIQA